MMIGDDGVSKRVEAMIGGSRELLVCQSSPVFWRWALNKKFSALPALRDLHMNFSTRVASNVIGSCTTQPRQNLLCQDSIILHKRRLPIT